MTNLKTFTALSTTRTIASKRYGNNVVFLAQSDSAFYLSFVEIVTDKNGPRLKLLAQKTLTAEEAHAVLISIFNQTDAGTTTAASVSDAQSDILLLEIALPEVIFDIPADIDSVESPYFQTKDFFLSSQKTNAPNSK
jgi:hypothetical protein